MIRVFIPPAMRPLTSGQDTIELQAATVGEAVDQLDRQYPGARIRLCDGERLRAGVSAVVNGQVATLGLRQPVAPGGELHFLPSIGGG